MKEHSTENNPNYCEPAEWVAIHGDALLGFALARVGKQDLAEDLVQETLLAAWQARNSFSNRSNFRTWLVGILRRKIADHYRRQGREPQRAEPPHDGNSTQFDALGSWLTAAQPWDETPHQLAENMEFWDVLARCISVAPAHLAIAFRLREFDSLSVDEICQRLDITRKHLSVRLHRARLALRECLQLNWFSNDQPYS